MSFTFRELLRQSATRFRDRLAVVDLAGDTQATYGDIDARANRLANGLVSFGLKRGDVVALLLPNGLRYLESEFAVGKAGLVRVGLMPSMDEASISQRFAKVTPSAVVLDGSQVDRVGAQCLQVLLSATATWQADGMELTVEEPSPAFAAALQTAGLDLTHLTARNN